SRYSSSSILHRSQPTSTLFPYTTLFRSQHRHDESGGLAGAGFGARDEIVVGQRQRNDGGLDGPCVHPAEIAGAFEHPGIETERRSEEHTSELQSRVDLVCRLLLEKKKDI